jgi:hypothetical protein
MSGEILTFNQVYILSRFIAGETLFGDITDRSDISLDAKKSLYGGRMAATYVLSSYGFVAGGVGRWKVTAAGRAAYESQRERLANPRRRKTFEERCGFASSATDPSRS